MAGFPRETRGRFGNNASFSCLEVQYGLRPDMFNNFKVSMDWPVTWCEMFRSDPEGYITADPGD